MKAKKMVSLLLAGIMTVSLTACGSGGTDSATTTESATENISETKEVVEEKSEGALDTSEQVDLVFYVIGDAPADAQEVEDAINEILLDKLNATIEFQASTWTDYSQKYNMALTSGDADLIYIANWMTYGQLANAGAFLELDELLDQYAPELKALVGEDKLNSCKVAGNIYAVPSAWDEYTSGGLAYREDLREKYDLPIPNSVENIEAYLLGIKENEPDQGLTAGIPYSNSASYGFSCATLVLGLNHSWVNPFGLAYGLTANYDTPSEVYDYWWSDEFVEDCKILKRWADEGFWSRSSLSNSNDTDLYLAGQTVLTETGMNPSKAVGYQSSFDDAGEGWKSEYVAYGETTGVIYPAAATQNGTAIVRGCKNPERAIAVLQELMCNEELNHLVQYGIEGVHYELDENGYYVNLDDGFAAEGFNTWNLRNGEYKLDTESGAKLQEIFAEYEEIGNKTKYPNVNIFAGFSEDYTSYEVQRTAIQSVISEYLSPLQAGLVDDVDAAVEEFRNKAKEAGIDEIRENYIAQWTSYCEEYGYR